MLFGYRVGEVYISKKIKDIKEGTKINRFRLQPDLNRRPPMWVSPGFNLYGSCLPSPDTTDPTTLLFGTFARFTTRPPTPKQATLKRFRKFVKTWLKKNIKPISPDEDLSFETWIKTTNYTDFEKKQFTKMWEERAELIPKDADVKMFMKHETYPEYKHGRAINSRTDRFKIEVGPVFKAIEHILFESKYFIKHVPAPERAKFVEERLAGWKTYISTDFTSFEALFTKELMLAAEMQLYEHCTKFHPRGPEFMSVLRRFLINNNHCKSKFFDMIVKATRMSGEMCTSLGNGFSNLMFMLFICSELGIKTDGIVEGDDGLFGTNGKAPTAKDFEELGLMIKIEEHKELNKASFCGQIFDTDTHTIITDPKKVLAQVGWIDGKYASANKSKLLCLLRAKAWSYGYQYPACPIISAMSRCILRNTRSYDARYILKTKLDTYERSRYEQMFKAGRPELHAEVAQSTRKLMSDVFGISESTQLKYEEWFDSQNSLVAIPNWLLVHPDTLNYYDCYFRMNDRKYMVDHPPEPWRKVHDVNLSGLAAQLLPEEAASLWNT